MPISEFDRHNVGKILSGHGDWFGADLLRLISKADEDNREKLRQLYPDFVDAYEQWCLRAIA